MIKNMSEFVAFLDSAEIKAVYTINDEYDGKDGILSSVDIHGWYAVGTFVFNKITGKLVEASASE